MSNSYAASLSKLNSDISYYFNIISSAIGVTFNLISIFIFARLMKNKTNMGFLYIWQCSVDLCVLLFFLLLFRSNTTLGINLVYQNDAACKFLTYLRRFILHASSWMVVLITVDRFIFVLYGHGGRFKFMKSKLNLTIIILAIFTVITIVDTPNFLFYLKSGVCTSDFVPAISSDIISICIRTYIPFAIMVVCNLLMIRKIFDSKRAVGNQQRSVMKKETHFTLAVMAYDVYFFLLNFPLSIYYIMADVNTYSGALSSGDAVFKASYGLASTLTSDLSFCVQTISLLTYIVFNKLFRQECIYLIGRVFNIKRMYQVQQIKTQTSTQNNHL